MAESKAADGVPIVIALGHKSHVGTGVIGEFLVYSYGFHVVSFADQLKVMTMVKYGLSHAEVYVHKDQPMERFDGKTSRQLLQQHGELLRATHGDNVLVDVVKQKIKDKISQGRDVVLTDVRLPAEFDMLEDIGAHLWKVTRQVSTLSTELMRHETEIALNNNTRWHLVIANNGTIQELLRKVAWAIP